jgi:hypothetical protein
VSERERPRTIGSALEELEGALFVGREAELETFRTWLDDPDGAPVLNVVGRGGMGKTTLLAAFRRHASTSGRPVIVVNAETIEQTPQGFLDALGTDPDPIESCNERRCLILIDGYIDTPWLTTFLQDDLLPRLSADVRVVIAGRVSLGIAWSRWTALIRTMTIETLAPLRAREYLVLRGVTQEGLAEQIVRATGGLPLALALAADVVIQLGAADLGAVEEWHRIVHALVGRLVHSVSDPQLVQLIEACSIVRHFDEPTLRAVTGADDVSGTFGRLCALSVVRAGEHGLMLHDDVRQVVVDDLRWRDPERYGALRERAQAYLRGRMAAAPQHERHWLWSERMFLWEDAIVQSLLFGPSTTGRFVVSSGGADDVDEIMQLEHRWEEEFLPAFSAVEWSENYPREGRHAWLRRAITSDGARIAIARDTRGVAAGYSLVLPLFQSSLRLLAADETLSALVRANWTDDELRALPRDPGDAEGYVIVRTCAVHDEIDAANGAIFRDLLGLLSLEGIYVVYAAFPDKRALYEALGFEPISTSEVYHWIREFPFQAYVLDLKRIGFEPWIEALMAGRPVRKRVSVEEVERELTELLPNLDDARVAASSLSSLARDAEGARAVLRAALKGVGAEAPAELELALRAVELAYIDRAAPHERLAERLSVSRSTFYRLLRRGVRALAETLGTAS